MHLMLSHVRPGLSYFSCAFVVKWQIYYNEMDMAIKGKQTYSICSTIEREETYYSRSKFI